MPGPVPSSSQPVAPHLDGDSSAVEQGHRSAPLRPPHDRGGALSGLLPSAVLPQPSDIVPPQSHPATLPSAAAEGGNLHHRAFPLHNDRAEAVETSAFRPNGENRTAAASLAVGQLDVVVSPSLALGGASTSSADRGITSASLGALHATTLANASAIAAAAVRPVSVSTATLPLPTLPTSPAAVFNPFAAVLPPPLPAAAAAAAAIGFKRLPDAAPVEHTNMLGIATLERQPAAIGTIPPNSCSGIRNNTSVPRLDPSSPPNGAAGGGALDAGKPSALNATAGSAATRRVEEDEDPDEGCAPMPVWKPPMVIPTPQHKLSAGAGAVGVSVYAFPTAVHAAKPSPAAPQASAALRVEVCRLDVPDVSISEDRRMQRLEEILRDLVYSASSTVSVAPQPSSGSISSSPAVARIVLLCRRDLVRAYVDFLKCTFPRPHVVLDVLEERLHLTENPVDPFVLCHGQCTLTADGRGGSSSGSGGGPKLLHIVIEPTEYFTELEDAATASPSVDGRSRVSVAAATATNSSLTPIRGGVVLPPVIRTGGFPYDQVDQVVVLHARTALATAAAAAATVLPPTASGVARSRGSLPVIGVQRIHSIDVLLVSRGVEDRCATDVPLLSASPSYALGRAVVVSGVVTLLHLPEDDATATIDRVVDILQSLPGSTNRHLTVTRPT